MNHNTFAIIGSHQTAVGNMDSYEQPKSENIVYARESFAADEVELITL